MTDGFSVCNCPVEGRPCGRKAVRFLVNPWPDFAFRPWPSQPSASPPAVWRFCSVHSYLYRMLPDVSVEEALVLEVMAS